MKKFTRLLVVGLLGCAALAPVLASAMPQGLQPLVVIRFNQPRVYFDQQLYGAIAKALEIKPDLTLDVVSLAPSVGNPETDKKWQAVAGRNTRSVIDAMKDMGVPMNRINVTGQSQPGLRYDETQVFVH